MRVREAERAELLAVNAQIAEFGTPYGADEFERRLAVPHLGLVAEEDGRLIGFKVGYELEPGVLYSWLGGVLREARGRGVARALLEAQEAWAVDAGYAEIRVKSRNRYAGMLILLLKAGYRITSVEPNDDPSENRVWFSKGLGAG